jgi:nitrite reductase/ring-hydroxylating ferredoxin subunit/uncharacterized membrane protein
MRSRANFRGHPIHPMLIPFPLAFLVGALAADLGASVLNQSDLSLIAWYLIPAGIVAGLVAAVPGLVDFLATVPPDSSGKKRGLRHMIVNVGALALFGIAWVLRGGPGVAPEPVIIALEALGALALLIGGWLGGTLAYRNQIGVDHRYAHAGKWSEARVDAESDGWATVARTDELELNQMKLVHVDGRRIVLARSDAGWSAFADRCTHRGGSLAGGLLACSTVTCPWHGSQFDVRTGNVSAGPASGPIQSFPVEVRGSEVRMKAG